MPRIAPRCTCRHRRSLHGQYVDGKLVEICRACSCNSYAPKRRISKRVSVPRRSPLKRTKRKILPKCKHCAHPEGKHYDEDQMLGARLCRRCNVCDGYEPARGIRQRRRTPLAAARLVADELWRGVVHARPEACEIQNYYPHTCVGEHQAMHGIPRTFQATRYWPINGFKGCAGVHKFFTDRPELWSAILLKAWGLATFRDLWNTARAMQPVDLEATVARLREELAKVQA